MGWRDRDYARVDGGSSWWPISPGRRFGGSVVTVLIVINVAIYLVSNLNAPLERRIYGWGHLTSFDVLRGQVWRLFTAQYLHAHLMHLFVNMLALHFLGRPLERLWSSRKFFTIYTLCGLCGNIFFVILMGILAQKGYVDARIPAVGASGCIYGLLGIVAVLFPTATVWVYFLFPIRIRTAAVIFGAIAFLSVLQMGPNYGGEACHLAGLVFGVWWALRGDDWWTRRRGFSFGRRARVRSAIPPYLRPSAFGEKIAERRLNANEVDRVLKKVYEGGIHSLTDAEKNLLREASEEQRRRELGAERTDRL